MGLIIDCSKCAKELNEPGAIVITPPTVPDFPYIPEITVCCKWHLCIVCFEKLKTWMHK